MEPVISLLYGPVRRDRQGIKAARFLEKKLKERDIDVRFIDPLEYQLPFLDKMYKEFPEGTAPESMETIAQNFRESDRFLVVTGEYNHSIPPALKNLLDHFQVEYMFKPSAIASYSAGSFGGVRAAVHLRVILGELGAPPISSIQPFPGVQDFCLMKIMNPKMSVFFLQQNGFIPNLYGIMAASSQLVKAYDELNSLFTETSFSTVEKNVVLLAVSSANKCHYCMSIHSMVAEMFKVPADVIESLRNNKPIESDPKLEALRKFTITMTETRGWPSSDEVADFLSAGYTKRANSGADRGDCTKNHQQLCEPYCPDPIG